MDINQVRSRPDQRNSIYKGPGDGGNEKWPVWLEQGRVWGGGHQKGYQGQAHAGPEISVRILMFILRI